MNCSPPGSSVHGISQARILEWVAISFSRELTRLRDGTCTSCFQLSTSPTRMVHFSRLMSLHWKISHLKSILYIKALWLTLGVVHLGFGQTRWHVSSIVISYKLFSLTEINLLLHMFIIYGKLFLSSLICSIDLFGYSFANTAVITGHVCVCVCVCVCACTCDSVMFNSLRSHGL